MSYAAHEVLLEVRNYFRSLYEAGDDADLSGRFSPGLPYQLHHRLSGALMKDMASAGIDTTTISTEARLDQAGGYSIFPHRWDLAVIEDDLPVILIEIKMVVRSAAKNVWNRIDEVVALAVSTARLFDNSEVAAYRPCIGLVFLLEDSASTREPRIRTGVEKDGVAAVTSTQAMKSVIESVGEIFDRMLADGVLDSIFLLGIDPLTGNVSEPFESQSFNSFVARIQDYRSRAARWRVRESTRSGPASLGRVLSRGNSVDEVVSGITSTPEGLSAAETAVIQSRRAVVADLKRLAIEPGVNETMLHEAIGKRYWIFGGQYVKVADRRTIVPLDQYDIPLVCADGSLEIVELKGPAVQLVKVHRNHYIVSGEVHEAVNQCLNYLRALDEMGAALRTQYRTELGVDFDFRRAHGLVVIGHSGRESNSGATREQIDQTIRSYNSHLSRLAVVTYADLLDSAERALRFESEEVGAAAASS